jgi:PBSX family phage terminase large subunit
MAEIILNTKYEPLWHKKTRYYLVTGGRGSGKSFGVSLNLTEQSYEPYFKCLFVRYFMNTAYDSIIPEVKSKIELMGIENDFHVTKTDIINTTTDNHILFRGVKTSSGDQTAKLKSLEGVNVFVVDEAEEFVDEEKFNTIDFSIRTTEGFNMVIIIMNPSHSGHWVYQRWFKNNHKLVEIDGHEIQISTHPEVTHIHTSFLDNLDNLDESFISKALAYKENNPDYYAHKFLGKWNDTKDGALFGGINRFSDIEMVLANSEGSLAYIDVADKGNDYLCMVVGHLIKNTVYITEVVYTQSDSDVTVPQCVEILNRNRVRFCQVESNNMGHLFSKMLRKEVKTTKILTINNSSNKLTRIIMNSSFVVASFMFLSKPKGEYYKYIDHLTDFKKDEKNEFDDAPDATSGLALFYQVQFPKLF